MKGFEKPPNSAMIRDYVRNAIAQVDKPLEMTRCDIVTEGQSVMRKFLRINVSDLAEFYGAGYDSLSDTQERVLRAFGALGPAGKTGPKRTCRGFLTAKRHNNSGLPAAPAARLLNTKYCP